MEQYCTKCGMKLKKGVKFCTSCGFKIEDIKEEPKPKVEQPEQASPVQEFPEHYLVCVSTKHSKRKQILNALKDDKFASDSLVFFASEFWDLGIVINLDRNKILEVIKQW